MSRLHLPWLWFSAAFLCMPSILYFFAGVAVRPRVRNGRSIQRVWNTTRLCSSVALLFALASCANVWIHFQTPKEPAVIVTFPSRAFALSFLLDAVTILMLLLVTFLGWIIVSYSRAYMSGDATESRYIRRLMYTLSAVGMLVVTNNLLVFFVSWVLTSLGLHGLLMLYPYRQAAVITAHKKFIASRLADAALLSGVLLLGSHAHTFQIDKIVKQMAELHSVPTAVHVAALLLAASALIKCAQLPLHGWLIQVMEAPTPVSALLHAGVVNLGGFMLIRLGMVIDKSYPAQSLLVVIGGLTATVASLVMTTRISIKVHLAWSTCAQMGFMLVECGLGFYGLAFLHLLAHSLYKAYAFLSSGETVRHAMRSRMGPHLPRRSLSALLISPLLGILAATISSIVWMPHVHLDVGRIACIVIVGFAVAGPLAALSSIRGIASAMLLGLSTLGVSLIYFGYDALFESIVQTAPADHTQRNHLLLFIVTCFALLYLVQSILHLRPLGRLARALYPWFYAGLCMDELFTRATFRIWPARRPLEASPRRDALQPFHM